MPRRGRRRHRQRNPGQPLRLQRHRRPSLATPIQRRIPQPQLRQVPRRHRLRRLRHPSPNLDLRRQLQPNMESSLMFSSVADRSRNRTPRRAYASGVVLALVAGLLGLGSQQAAHAAADANIAVGAEATASSVQGADTSASAAVDGDPTTRWSSAWSDPQWLQLDLGADASISGLSISWEAAFATAYHIEVSSDATTWSQVYSTTSGAGGTETISV